MPFEIQFDQLPVGYSAHSARANEQCLVISKEFVSSEDGQFFISRLEGFPDEILERVRPQKDFRPSSVNHLLAIVRKDCSCTVFINELSLITEIRPRRSIKKGELVTKNDVVDTGRLILENTQVPPDAGVVFLFSVGWRKGLFMDLTPIVPDGSPRVQDLEILFGRYFRYLLFQERLSLSDEDWDLLFKAGWFPFTSLKEETIALLLSAVRAGWEVDDVLNTISEDLDESLDLMLSSWGNHPAFQSHLMIVRNAIERYRSQDFISCVSILETRIEGVLRSHKTIVEPLTRAVQATLANAVAVSHSNDDMSLLLPHRFSEYLKQVYFANFNPTHSTIDISRNAVGHGVANESAFNKKAAVRAILVLHQLFYTFGTYGGDSNKEPANDESTDQ